MHRHLALWSLLLLAAFPTSADAALARAAVATLARGDAGRLQLAPVDTASLAQVDAQRDLRPGTPYRYGRVQRVLDVVQDAERSQGGVWTTRPDGSLQWRLQIEAPQARSLELGFSRLRLPAGATLSLHGAAGRQVIGPLTDADNRADGRYHSPMLEGGSAWIELQLPAARRSGLVLQLDHVVFGYRAPFRAEAKSAKIAGSCNVDTICPEGDDYREPIAATALYTFANGFDSFSCSGTLITTGDHSRDAVEPRFVTANHCISSAAAAQAMVFYWGYESPVCRAPGSAASGDPLPRESNTRATQSGATLLATEPTTDFTIVQLLTPVPSAAQAWFTGWDRSGVAPPASVGVHHPQGEEKRITFNRDPLTLMGNCIASEAPGSSHWRIDQYELGTTETGSSGSGLWADLRDETPGGPAEDERLIGVLTGGTASCAVPDGYDCYGRLSQAWEFGQSSDQRMRDWFDRTGTNPVSLPGKASCPAQALSLDSPAFSNAPAAGSVVTFTASSGGSGNRGYSWDVDGDGVFERETSGATLQVTYPRAQQLQVGLRVTASDGCVTGTSRALDVRAASLVATAGEAQQVCGDNDAVFEPGERWRLPVTLRNSGNAALPAGARALFARGTGVAALATAEFNGQGFGPLDDARTVAPIALGGGGLRLYGQVWSQAFMSTNGYVSFNPAETGGDWDNSCGGGIDNGAAGPQLRPLHDDLLVSGESNAGLRYAYFAQCPRAAETTPAAQGCHVFQWSRMRWIDSAQTSEISGDATFQAIVYQPSGQIVYQYLVADPYRGGRATIGVVGTSGTNGDPLDVACNLDNAAPAGRAICLFDPAAPPAGGFPAGTVGPNGYGYRAYSNAGAGVCPYQPIDLAAAQPPTALRVETPTVGVPALEPGQQATVDVGLALSPAATCGSVASLEYIGTAAPGVSSFGRSRVLTTSAGVGANCQVSNACAAQIPAIATRPGFYYNPQRSGNGLANFVYGNVYGGVWYTALADRSPTWYILSGDYADHLGVMPIRRFRNPAAPAGFAPEHEFAGTAWVAQIDNDSLLQAWQFDDGVQGLELLDATPLPFTNPNHSQTWYSTAESGWGLSIESLMTAPSTALEFMVGYIYDASGTARWVLGTSDSTSGGTVPVSTYRVHCPSCPWFVDWATSEQPAGSFSRTYTGPISALFSSQIVLPPPLSGSWNRSNLPLTTIGTPAPPGE